MITGSDHQPIAVTPAAAIDDKRWMTHGFWKRTELAQRLGKSKSWISQLLAGEANFTLRTLADVFGALGQRAAVDVERQSDRPSTHFAHSEMDAGAVMWRQYDWIPKYPAQAAVAQSPDPLLAG